MIPNVPSWLFVTLQIIIIALFVVDIMETNHSNDMIKKEYEDQECGMFIGNDFNASLVKVSGYYSYLDQYYCVWVYGRYFQAANNTEKHEVCHALIQHDYEHFCQEYTQEEIEEGLLINGK